MLIPRRSPGSVAPLTPAQSRLWFLDRAGVGDTTYFLWSSRRYRGPLDPDAWGRALGAVVARHEALRSAVEVTADGPVQVVVDTPLEQVLETVDLTGRPDPERAARSLSAEFIRRPLPLTRAPLHRALLLRLAPEDHVFVWCWHHIVFDAVSEQVVMDELLALYRGEDVGEPPVQFPDYAAALAETPLSTRGVEYWREQLRDAPAVQSLPSDHARPAAGGLRAARWERHLSPELSSAVLAVARQERCTPFIVFMSAMTAVLARHSGEPDVVVGTPLSDRDAPGLERSVGFYVNTLPVRVNARGDLSLRTLLREVRAALFDAMDHRTIPLEEIVRAAGAARDPGRNPLFQTMLVVQSDAPPAGADDLTAEDWPLEATSTPMDLTLVVTLAERITLACDYAADLFPEAQIRRFGDHVVAVLDALVRDPQQRLSEVPLLDAAERAALLGDPAPSGPAPASVVEQFAAVAAAQPDAPALVTPEGTLTYGELDRRVRAVAQRVAGAALVGIVLPTGTDAVVAVLGALTAGAAYLPLSPADPPSRTAELLRAAGADHVIADGELPALPENGAPSPAGLAYVIFTSGSTGRPKGVLVGHDTLARFTAAFREVHGFGQGQRILMLPPLTFDASVGDLFPALTSGAALVLHPEPARLDAAELVAFCARHGVTAVDAPASLWRSWTDDLASGTVRVPRDWPVTTMMVGGERVPTAAVRAWAEATHHRVTLFNHYGPTEATVCATVHRTVDGDATDGTHLPIGRPLPHVRAYVLDPAGGLSVPGAPGELYLGGDCLALGYLGEPAATEAAFPPDPFHGGRMYKTGDLVRLRADGSLEFLGRADRQVKIRGHRIEPAEVEATVTAHPAVRDAAVIAVDGRLVAYAATAAPVAELRRFVRDRLPRHLVPDQFLLVDRIPRSAHGKIELGELPPATIETAAAAPPEGPVETALAAIWSSLLDVPDVGRTDSFFALGGSSLMATRVLAAIERELGRTVPLATVLEADDLADLARALTAAPAPAPALLERLPADVVPSLRRSSPMRTVLVTGATGFLGAHLVAELLGTSDVTVECLVRAGSAEQARERVLQSLSGYRLAADPRRIVGLAGDLAEPRFGLTERAWHELALRCDVICHNGSAVSGVESYERLRPANVGGTIEALRLAALGGAALHAVSTLSVYMDATRGGKPITELDAPGEPEALATGYEQTKAVADRLCRDARAVGLAVSVHRPARISGHSVTGRGNPDDYFNRLLTTFVQTGCVPDLPWTEDLAPVDRVAAGIVTLLREPAGRDYHYFNPATISYPELAGALVDRGYDVRLVPWATWRAEVNGRLATGAPLALAPFVTSLPEQRPSASRPDFDCAATERVAGTFPPADRELVGRQLDFLASTGRIPRGAVG